MTESLSNSQAPSSTSSTLNPPPSSRIICRVCQKQFAQYTCPRCNTRYCSLHCYKSHSLRCTESFMRKNVMEELQQLKPNDETKQKMMDILRRFHSEEDLDCSDEPVESTYEDGSQISFDDLSADEKKRFERAVASGDLSRLIEPWEPWWLKPSARTISLSHQGSQLVQPLVKHEMSSSQENFGSEQSPDRPPGPETPLPPISKLSTTEPSPLLAVHLVDVIYSYCFTLRLYNGEWQSDPIGSATLVLSISSVLGQGGHPGTVSEALSHCLEQTCSPTFRHMGGLQFGLGLLDDVVSLLSLGGTALVCLLCDLHRLIQVAERELKFEKPHKSKREEIKRNLKSAERKIFYMMCWVHEQPGGVWVSLSTLVEAEKGVVMAGTDSRKYSLRVEERVKPRGKVLIEEVQ